MRPRVSQIDVLNVLADHINTVNWHILNVHLEWQCNLEGAELWQKIIILYFLVVYLWNAGFPERAPQGLPLTKAGTPVFSLVYYKFVVIICCRGPHIKLNKKQYAGIDVMCTVRCTCTNQIHKFTCSSESVVRPGGMGSASLLRCGDHVSFLLPRFPPGGLDSIPPRLCAISRGC